MTVYMENGEIVPEPNADAPPPIGIAISEHTVMLFNVQGITVNEGARNIYRAFGHDVILTPDDQIIEVTDAPAIEHADGRKYKADGTVYDG